MTSSANRTRDRTTVLPEALLLKSYTAFIALNRPKQPAAVVANSAATPRTMALRARRQRVLVIVVSCRGWGATIRPNAGSAPGAHGLGELTQQGQRVRPRQARVGDALPV